MVLSLSETVPLRRLLSRIGKSTYQLNTVLVGLYLVEGGAGDGGSIAVGWTKPSSEAQARNTAAQAKSFVCAGTLVFSVDVFDSFLRALPREAWLRFSEETIDIATKSKTRLGGAAYSVSERAAAICEDLGLVEPRRIALIELLAKWRNVAAHNSEQDGRIDPKHRQVLLDDAAVIHQEFSHLDVEMAVRNFERGALPVPKEVTSLVANAVKLGRALDVAAIKRVASSECGIQKAVEDAIERFFSTGQGAASPKKLIGDAWEGPIDRRLATVKKWLGTMAITEAKTPISHVLPDKFLDDLVAMPKAKFEARFLSRQ